MKKHISYALILISLAGIPMVSYAIKDNSQDGKEKNEKTTTADDSPSKDATSNKPVKENTSKQPQPGKEDKKGTEKDERFEKAQEKALQAVDRRITHLTEALNRMAQRKRLREKERALLDAEIQKSLQSLATAKESIEAATDMETLKIETKKAIENTRVYAVIVPKIRAMAMTSSMYNAIDRVEKVFPKVEQAIQKNPEKNNETTKLYGQAMADLASAEIKTNEAWSEFVKMVPAEDMQAAKIHLEAGKSLLKEARSLLKNCVITLKQIKELLGTEETAAETTSETEDEPAVNASQKQTKAPKGKETTETTGTDE